jgi:LysM repeat protein
MKWKDTEDSGSHENEEEYAEEAYSPLKSRKFFLGFDWFSLFGKPVFWVVVGAFILAILVIVLVPWGDSGFRQGDAVEKRLALLENRLELLDQIGSRLEQLEKNTDDTKPLMVRLERLETSIAKKLTEMSDKITQIEKQAAAAVVKQDVKADAPAAPAGQYHVVKKGETLYSIGKQYGLSVDQLTRLNTLSKGSPIQPGQRLLLK